jgi:hypothetical protein
VDGGASFQLSDTFSNLSAGVYPVVVTFYGASNCTIPPLSVTLAENILTNTWTGAGDGSSWTDLLNWSLQLAPRACHHVLIPPGNSVLLKSGQTGDAQTIEVQQGAILTVEQNAQLNVKQ